MQGRITKGIAGFYYVYVEEKGLFECKAKGLFRKQKIKPMVGDMVEIDVISDVEMTGNVISILPRKTELIRPAVANADQAVIIFSVKSPEPNLNLLDRFLVMMEQQQVSTVICFNKCDLASEEEIHALKEIYKDCGCELLFISAKEQEGITAFRELLKGKITVVAGPSGVGKSSTINLLQSDVQMETGAISVKLERGKHTTRHSQLIYIEEDTYIFDTPGFSSLYLMDMEASELKDYYPEYVELAPECRFQGCVHINEPNCRVKQAIADKELSRIRYENYKTIYEECKNTVKYK